MAALLASGVVKRAADALASLLPSSTTPSAPSSSTVAAGDVEELRKLERTMLRIHATLEDAEDAWVIRDATARLRLTELKEVAYDAEDVVGEYEYEVARCRVEALDQERSDGGKRKRGNQAIENNPYRSFGHVHLVPVPRDLVGRAREIEDRYNEIIKGYEDLRLSDENGQRIKKPDCILQQRQTSSVAYQPAILGREADKEAVLQKLLSGGKNNANPLSVLAIVGMGGIGKTTLAQLVYNDPRLHLYVDMTAWIYVSENFDVMVLTKNTMSAFGAGGEPRQESSLGNLQRALMKEVEGKRFLIILDDVWNVQLRLWESFCTPFMKAKFGMILVTTRNVAVAKLVQTMPFYSLGCLNLSVSWSLFELSAFREGHASCGKFVEIGKKIVYKCKGLPLAIRTLGSMLRYESNEDNWKHVLENESWDLDGKKDEILPALELSYKQMPLHLKRCFTAFSLFPKGEILSEEKVIHLWKSLGLLHRKDRREDEVDGRSYVTELLGLSLIQREEYGLLSMHDLLHDLARFVAGEEFLLLESHMSVEISPQVRYISGDMRRIKWRTSGENGFHLQGSNSLRAIHPRGRNFHSELFEEVFLQSINLRVIDLYHSFITGLPDSIGCLKQLRYLCLTHTWIQVLPTSIGNLFNLQTLDCEGCPIRKVPTCLRNLVNLQHLILNHVPYLPNGIGCLTKLQTLPFFRVAKSTTCCSNISELKNLDNLRGVLCISQLCNIGSVDEAHEARLKAKQHLQGLELQYDIIDMFGQDAVSQETVLESLQETVLESLQPHQNLKTLSIDGFRCRHFPTWLDDVCLFNLAKIELKFLQCEHLPTLGQLPSLTYIKIMQIGGLKSVGSEFCRKDASARGYQVLMQLEFSDMLEWAEWFGVEDGEFCSLQTLKISSCHKLKTVPSVLSSSLASLEIICCESLLKLPTLPSLDILHLHQCGNLTELPALPKLTKLYLKFCRKLFVISLLPSLRALEITECPRLTILPAMPLLVKMKCVGCSDLQVISSLPSLKELHIIGCPILTTLCNMPSLIEMKCVGCSDLQVISSLPSLKELHIIDCPILTTLCNMPSLIEMKCVGCSDLQVICSLPSLKELHIIDCPILTTLCNMPSLIEMNCDGCSGLRAISVPSLRRLVIHDCPSLTKLQCLPSLTELSCLTCPNLSMITPLPSLKDLVISGCPSLEALPQMPSLTSLRCARCPGLNVVSPLPSLAELHVTDCPNVKTLQHLPLLTTMRLEGEFCDEFFSGLLNFHHTLLEEIFIFSDSAKCVPLSQHNLPSLAYLVLGCANMEGELAGFESLRVLEILNCPKLCVHEVLKAQLQILEIHDKSVPIKESHCDMV